MNGSVRVQTVVLPGHRIEIRSAELPEGQRVDVVVTPATYQAPLRPSMLDFLQTLPPGPLLYPTARDADLTVAEGR
jgi:hypothetical protein